MNKDFEQAYREMAQNEAPDLWDRIEAGLSEKSAPVLSMEQTKEAVTSQEQKKIEVLLPYRKYITLAAALLCVVILIPVAGMIFRSSGGYSSSGTPALENGAGGSAADMAAAEEAEESTSETAAGTLGVADTASPAQNNAAPYAQLPQKEEAAEAAAPAEIKEAENTLDAMDAGMAESDILKDSAESRIEKEVSASEKVMSDLERLKEDEVISHVIIRVQETEHIRDAGDIDEAGTLYTFLVEKETSGVLSVGEAYVLFVPVYSSYAFIEDEVYEVDLSYQEGEKYSFVLKGYYG